MAKVVTDGDIGSGLEIVAGKLNRSAITKADIGLGNVDNTTDANKPISTATQTSLDTKQATLVSGGSIKTINGNSILGSGDLEISGGSASIDPLESNIASRTVWNNGKGDIATNTSFGDGALNNNVTGSSNSAYGYQSLYSNTSGFSNLGIGKEALYYNTTGSNNVSIGDFAGKSDSFINDNTICNTSVFIGLYSRPHANNEENQIVIGFGANGAGSNTATLGSTDIVKTVLRGTINVAGLPTYASNSDAVTGGLIVGDIYKNSTGELRVRY